MRSLTSIAHRFTVVLCAVQRAQETSSASVSTQGLPNTRHATASVSPSRCAELHARSGCSCASHTVDPSLSLVIVLRSTHSARNEPRCRQPVKHADSTERRKFGSASRRSERTAAPAAMKRLAIPWLGRTNLSLARCSACHTAWLQSRHECRFNTFL